MLNLNSFLNEFINEIVLFIHFNVIEYILAKKKI